jgi:hypothetical protein
MQQRTFEEQTRRQGYGEYARKRGKQESDRGLFLHCIPALCLCSSILRTMKRLVSRKRSTQFARQPDS